MKNQKFQTNLKNLIHLADTACLQLLQGIEDVDCVTGLTEEMEIAQLEKEIEMIEKKTKTREKHLTVLEK